MSFSTTCPNCDARLQVPDTLAGKMVKCKKCEVAFAARRPADSDADEDVPARPAKAAPPKVKPRPPADADDEPRRPLKKSRPAADDADDEPRARRRDDDADDRPRRKAGGKKKKGKKKSAVGTVLMFTIAGFVALAVGVPLALYFAYWRQPDLETTELGNTVAGGPGKAAGGPAAAGGTAGWVDVRDADGRYALKFPTAPQEQTVQQNTPAGPVPVKIRTSSNPTEGFICAHQAIPADRPGVTDDQILDQAVEVAKMTARGGQVQSTKPISYQGFSGREVTVLLPGKEGTLIQRFVLAKDRVIMVAAGGETASADSPRVKAFFESLKIE